LLIAAALLTAAPAGALDEGADGSFEKRTSAHFVLHQDVDIDETGGLHGSRRFEQTVLAELERAYDRLDAFLGLRPPRKIHVVVYDPVIFDREFAKRFRFAVAGFYHGVVRVRGATQVDLNLTRVLHHELVHAALHAAAPSLVLPGWLNEGLAEWFEARAIGQRHFSRGGRAILVAARRSGSLLPLSALSDPSFSRLPPDAARLAYLQSYGVVEFLVRQRSQEKDALRRFCQELVRRRNLPRALDRVFRIDLETLEARFVADLDGPG
jgi:hypothetical protein